MSKLISRIEMTRGDTQYIRRKLTDEEGNILTLNPETDKIDFTVRQNIESEVLIHKDNDNGINIEEDGIIEIVLTPEDTETLEFGEYGFDIQVTIGKDESVPFVKTPNSGTINLLEDDFSRPLEEIEEKVSE